MSDYVYVYLLITESSVVSKTQYATNEDGEIELTIPSGQKGGKFKFSVRNSEWADSSAFTYTYSINISDKDPKVTLKSATTTLNKNYPEQPAEFTLSSNQIGTQFAAGQTFDAKAPKGKEAEYEKLGFTCDENGNGKVEILDPSIAKGTYKYACTVQGVSGSGYDMSLNSVTLTVKVNDTAPTVTAKGTLTLNRNAVDAEEPSELALAYKNLPEDYVLDEQATADTIKCTTKNSGGMESSFLWQFEDHMLKATLLDMKPKAQTYTFEMTPRFLGGSGAVTAKKMSFKVKVHSGAISVKLAAKGKINLLDRGSEKYTEKNSIICTPTIVNLKDTIGEVKIYDVTNQAVEYEDEESEYFSAALLEGKIYVTPKMDAEIENNKNYKVKVWVKLHNYSFTDNYNGGGTWCTNVLTIKTAQTLPKITVDKTNLSLYTSHKDYEATFVVTPKEGSVGMLSKIAFDEKDEKSLDSFDLSYAPQENGSLLVTMKLKTASYPCNTINKIKMYVIYEGQGVNTKGTAITMNVNIVSKN